MGLIYDFYQNPTPKESSDAATKHARVVTSETVNTQELAAVIADRSTINAGEVKGMLDLLSDVLVYELSQSRRVHIDGLGYFRLSLSCPSIVSEKEIRSESIHVRSVVFRPEQRLKAKVQQFKMERLNKRNRREKRTNEEVEKLLGVHFQHNSYISVRQFALLAGISPSTANLKIKKLVIQGKLKRIGTRSCYLYLPFVADLEENKHHQE